MVYPSFQNELFVLRINRTIADVRGGLFEGVPIHHRILWGATLKDVVILFSLSGLVAPHFHNAQTPHRAGGKYQALAQAQAVYTKTNPCQLSARTGNGGILRSRKPL